MRTGQDVKLSRERGIRLGVHGERLVDSLPTCQSGQTGTNNSPHRLGEYHETILINRLETGRLPLTASEVNLGVITW